MELQEMNDLPRLVDPLNNNNNPDPLGDLQPDNQAAPILNVGRERIVPPVNQPPRQQAPQQQSLPLRNPMMRIASSLNFHAIAILVMTSISVFYGCLVIRNVRARYSNSTESADLDILMDHDLVPISFQWVITCTALHLLLMVHKLLEISLLIWRPYPQNPSNINAQAALHESTILEYILRKHHFTSLLALLLIGGVHVFATSFEYLVFVSVYTIHSFILASDYVLERFNKKIIETQVSFSSSLLLRKNEIFQTRVANIKKYQKLLFVWNFSFTWFIGWLFLSAGYTYVFL